MNIVDDVPGSVRLRVSYNRNKFYKQPIAPATTAQIFSGCPICGSALIPITAVRDGSGQSVLDRGGCAACGYVVYTRMPSADWFAEFYRSFWDHNRDDESIEQKTSAPYNDLLEVLRPLLTPQSSVLEL